MLQQPITRRFSQTGNFVAAMHDPPDLVYVSLVQPYFCKEIVLQVSLLVYMSPRIVLCSFLPLYRLIFDQHLGP